MRWLAVAASWLGCGLLLSAGCAPVDRAGAPADPFVVTIAPSWVPEIDHFVHAVESISDGDVRVEFVGWLEPGSIRTGADIVEFMRESGADLGVLPARDFHNLGVREFDALHAPLLIDSFELQRAVLESDTAVEMLRGMERIGLVGVGLSLGPIVRLVGVSGPLLAPEDFRGADLAMVNGGTVAARSLADLGARPYPISLNDPVQLRGFDGLESSMQEIEGLRLDTAAHSVVANIGLRPEPIVIFAGESSWGRLPHDIRRVLRQAATGSAGSRAEKDSGDAEAVSAICRRGKMPLVTASPGQRAALLAAFGPTYSWLKEDPATRSFLERISAIKESVEPGPALACSGAEKVRPEERTSRTPLDGTWKTRVTASQLEKSPLRYDAGEASEENWGDFELQLERGEVTLQNVNSVGFWGTQGTFEVEGDILTLTFTSGVNAGEVFAMRWSLYRGQLRLTRDEAVGIAPTPFLINTWRRDS